MTDEPLRALPGEAAGLKFYLRTIAEIRARCGVNAHIVSWPHKSFESFVLANGRDFESRTPTGEQVDYVRALCRRHTYASKACFENAQRVFLSEPGRLRGGDRLRYVEGYMAGLIPVLHAWCLLDGEVLIDPTLLANGSPRFDGPGKIESGIIGTVPSNRSYFGVVFPRDLVIRMVPRMTQSFSFIDQPEHDYPALRGEWDAELKKER